MSTVTKARPRSLAALAVSAAEGGQVPDNLIRIGMNRVISARLKAESERLPESISGLRTELWSGPIATHTDDANEQHYEIPGSFFDLVLGARRKYSSGYWAPDVGDLDSAEEAMLELYAERADLRDGQAVLDLGCGWGSFALWAAERYPNSQIVGVSNSEGQKAHIDRLASEQRLENLKIVTADINEFRPEQSFDRIVSIEMLEHVRNHRELFRRARSWLRSDGKAFVHVFAHRRHEYPYEVSGPGSWMARTFFTGGLMPSAELIPDAAKGHFRAERSWWIEGTHYSKTLEAWLQQMDESRVRVREILEPVYGEDVDLWLQRWRMFFMACSQMFRYKDGTEWGVSHHLLAPR